MMETVRKLYRSELFRWLFSFACALALVAIAAKLSTLSYYDNDDLNIAWALAGYRTGTPSFAHPFINCLLGFIATYRIHIVNTESEEEDSIRWARYQFRLGPRGPFSQPC